MNILGLLTTTIIRTCIPYDMLVVRGAGHSAWSDSAAAIPIILSTVKSKRNEYLIGFPCDVLNWKFELSHLAVLQVLTSPDSYFYYCYWCFLLY
jgi:hypothetical protein